MKKSVIEVHGSTPAPAVPKASAVEGHAASGVQPAMSADMAHEMGHWRRGPTGHGACLGYDHSLTEPVMHVWNEQ
jgi:hypothetical protein